MKPPLKPPPAPPKGGKTEFTGVSRTFRHGKENSSERRCRDIDE
ncbi:hypothetical protein HMPREF0971_00319 [Segatella oris F0302]|uniref:Uncharacterized protein n=1 Tax=Segatella oris F0302 TaxID=649760 RepID=D1QMN5_9BACT|nr:hypothetical protein HMPREF0971_00319 [Segatella oris F0302]